MRIEKEDGFKGLDFAPNYNFPRKYEVNKSVTVE